MCRGDELRYSTLCYSLGDETGAHYSLSAGHILPREEHGAEDGAEESTVYGAGLSWLLLSPGDHSGIEDCTEHLLGYYSS